VDFDAEAKRLRETDLDELTKQAIELYGEGSPGRRAELELERRLIAESVRASQRLLWATVIIAILTLALIVIAVLEAFGVLGE
jgi:hypothetical protein